MESLAQKFTSAVYDHQKDIPVDQDENTLSVSAGGTLSNNTYKLLNWTGRTTYIVVATNYGDSVFHPAKSGVYEVKILNSVATGLVLYSKVIHYTAPGSAIIASADNVPQQDHKTNLFHVYPNPARNILHIETNGNAVLSLIDQSGKILLTTTINGKGTINVLGIVAGSYYLKNNTTNTVKEVIIAR
jgi:hypothetical protein